MPLAIKHHAVPHLNSLIVDWNPEIAMGVAVVLWAPC